ncbi:MAG: hypothetical protein ABIW38_00225 [Ferruginibacter sp.]
MKVFLLLLSFPMCCFGQYKPNEKIPVKAMIVSDSGTIHGYFLSGSDSSIILNKAKRYSVNTTISIPASTIKELRFKSKKETPIAIAPAAFVLGFIITAGLTKNAGDFDDDGNTSFLELILTAIEGTTSSNRKRRNTALIVGAAGGTAAMLAVILTTNKMSIVFPIKNRNDFYKEKRMEINNYAKF